MAILKDFLIKVRTHIVVDVIHQKMTKEIRKEKPAPEVLLKR